MLFFEKLEQKKLYVLLIFIIVMIFSTLYSCLFINKEYIASSTIMLVKVDHDVNNGNIQLSDNLYETLKELIKNEDVVSKVREDLSLNAFSRDKIKVSRVKNSDAFKISVKSMNSDQSLSINNKLISTFKINVENIYKDTTTYIISDNTIIGTTYGIRICLVYVVGFILFSLIIIVYILILIYLEKYVKSLNDIEVDMSLKELVEIPLNTFTQSEKRKYPELISYESEKSNISKAFQKFRSNIQFLNVNNKGRNIILVTSSNPKEGKSYITANLAVSFAEVGKKVILIDADMKEGRLGKIFNIPNNLGFSNYLSGLDSNGIEINELTNKFIKETATKNLNLITSGTIPPNTAELLASDKLAELIKDLTVFYDVVIIDSNSVLNSTDPLILSRIATSTIIVSDYKKTKKDDLWKAKRDIQNIGGRIIGVVLNKVHIKDEDKNEKVNKKNNDKNKIKETIILKINNTKSLLKNKFSKKSEKKLLGPSIENKDNIIEKKSDNKKIPVKVISQNVKNNNEDKIIKAEKSEVKINDLKFSDFVNNGSFSKKDISEVKINNHENENISKDKLNNEFMANENIEEPIRIPKMGYKELFNDFSKKIENAFKKIIDIIKCIPAKTKNVFSFVKKNVCLCGNFIIKYSVILKEKILILVNSNKKEDSNNIDNIEQENKKIISSAEKVDDIVSNEIEHLENNNTYSLKNTNPIISYKEKDIIEENKDSIIDKKTIREDKPKENNIDEENSQLSDDGVLIIVDAENAYCRAFSKICFTEKLVRGIDRSDGLVKAYYSANTINKIYRSISDRYEIPKENLKRIDSLIYVTLNNYDETVWIEKKIPSRKTDAYIMAMTQEYEKLPNESTNEYNVRCQRLRKNELIKNDIDIEYKLENILSITKMTITDKIMMKKFANYFEIKENFKNENEIEKSKENKAVYNSIVNAISKFKKGSANNESKKMTEEELAEVERLKQEKIRIKEEKKKIAEEKRKLKKEEKEEKKLIQQQEKMKKQQELKILKEEEKEKARIEEELLGDNLYPKTKNNKNI